MSRVLWPLPSPVGVKGAWLAVLRNSKYYPILYNTIYVHHLHGRLAFIVCA